MRNRKAIRLRPSQGGSMARSVGPDDDTRARIAASDALVLAPPAQVMGRSRRDGGSYFIPSPSNASTNGWQALPETLFHYAADGDVALVSRVDMHNRVLLCKFYHPTGKCRTPPMTVYEDETTGWRELTPDEVRSFREKIAKAHGEAYEHAI